MPREAKPWFYNQTGWWMAWIHGKKVKLAKGRGNKTAAKRRLEELRVLARSNPVPEAPQQTVLSIIERYIEVRFPTLSKSTSSMRLPYLQSFAEAHGWRPVDQCGGDDLEHWLHTHPEWKSDWTQRDAVMTIQTVFNWAAKAGRISRNPFRGFSKQPGSGRRDMTRQEFQAILRNTGGDRKHKRPTRLVLRSPAPPAIPRGV